MSEGLRFDPRFRCQALTTSTGERCKRPAHPGATVCVKHGAGAPQVRAKAKQRLARQRVEHQLGQLLQELEDETLVGSNPVEVLADTIVRANAMVQVLGVLVGRLKPEQGNWERPGRLMGLNHLGDGAPDIAVTMYLEWLKEAGRLSKLAIDAGLEERRTQMTEAAMEELANWMNGLLIDLGVKDRFGRWHNPEAPEVVTRHTRALRLSFGRAGIIDVSDGPLEEELGRG